MPDADRAFVEPEKLSGYLLSETHPDGAGKAAFFIAFGFSVQDPEGLRRALCAHAQSEVAEEVASAFGKRYIIDAPLETPSGRKPWVRSVWEVKDKPPRLLTAFPTEAKAP